MLRMGCFIQFQVFPRIKKIIYSDYNDSFSVMFLKISHHIKHVEAFSLRDSWLYEGTEV